MDRDPKEDLTNKIIKRSVISTLCHPLLVSRTLIELGYDPFPTRITSSIFGKQINHLPNIFNYVHHVYSIDGLWGCYRGLGFHLCRNIVGTYVSCKLLDYKAGCGESDECNGCGDKRQPTFWQQFADEIGGYSILAVSTYPLQVLTTRAIAEFVGRETRYSLNIFSSFWNMVADSGFRGFYTGFFVQYLGGLLAIFVTTLGTHLSKKYFQLGTSVESLTKSSFSVIMSHLVSPYVVVAKTMAINNIGIRLGYPPYAPIYSNWTDCWNQLSRQNQLYRGQNMFFRQISTKSNINYPTVSRSSLSSSIK